MIATTLTTFDIDQALRNRLSPALSRVIHNLYPRQNQIVSKILRQLTSLTDEQRAEAYDLIMVVDNDGDFYKRLHLNYTMMAKFVKKQQYNRWEAPKLFKMALDWFKGTREGRNFVYPPVVWEYAALLLSREFESFVLNRRDIEEYNDPLPLTDADRAWLKSAIRSQQEPPITFAPPPGYHPTPPVLVGEMIQRAGIRRGMKVLEPSAGDGAIADAIRLEGVEPDVIEIYPSLSRMLVGQKGYNLVADDFLQYEGQTYDRILMNPPFEKMADAEHVMHAYSLLRPAGRLVAIMGEGVFTNSLKKAVAFRNWLQSVGGDSKKNAAGSFKDSAVKTGVSTRIVVIDKPVERNNRGRVR